jgi:hypothetical protein
MLSHKISRRIQMLDFVRNNQYLVGLLVAAIGIIPPLLTFAISIYNTSQSRKEELSNRQYTQYHQLIGDLASNAKGVLDSQTAIVYELRFYRKYRHATIRILNNLKNTWGGASATGPTSLLAEIDLAIEVLRRNPISWIWYRIKEKLFKA